MKLKGLIVLSILACLTGCSGKNVKTQNRETQMTLNQYSQITQEEAKRIMDNETGYIVVDAREKEEFEEGHIPGAILIPYTEAAKLAPSMLPKKDQLVLIYCRSGRRSKIGAQTLADMGYTDVREFGGIITWPYEIEK